MKSYECLVYAYLHLNDELMATLTRKIRLPFVPRVGMVFNGNSSSCEASSVAWDFLEDRFTIMCLSDDNSNSEDFDDSLGRYCDDGFSVAVDYRATPPPTGGETNG